MEINLDTLYSVDNITKINKNMDRARLLGIDSSEDEEHKVKDCEKIDCDLISATAIGNNLSIDARFRNGIISRFIVPPNTSDLYINNMNGSTMCIDCNKNNAEVIRIRLLDTHCRKLSIYTNSSMKVSCGLHSTLINEIVINRYDTSRYIIIEGIDDCSNIVDTFVDDNTKVIKSFYAILGKEYESLLYDVLKENNCKRRIDGDVHMSCTPFYCSITTEKKNIMYEVEDIGKIINKEGFIKLIGVLIRDNKISKYKMVGKQ